METGVFRCEVLIEAKDILQRACMKMAQTLTSMDFCPAGSAKERETGCMMPDRIGALDCELCIMKYYLAIAEVEEKAALRLYMKDVKGECHD